MANTALHSIQRGKKKTEKQNVKPSTKVGRPNKWFKITGAQRIDEL